MCTKQMTFFALPPKIARSLPQDGKFGGLERVLGALLHVVRSLLRDGKFGVSGAGFGGTKQMTFLLFSPKSLDHFYGTANLGV